MHRATVRKFLNKKEFYKDNLYIEELEFKKILPHIVPTGTHPDKVDLSSSFKLKKKDLDFLISNLG